MPKPNVVSFTNLDTSQTYHLSKCAKMKSREALGVWIGKDTAWKVFSNTGGLWDRVNRDYPEALAKGLIWPGTKWFKAQITCDDGKNKNGFVVESKFINVNKTSYRFFKLDGGLKHTIKSIKNVDTLREILWYFVVAKDAGLRDTQGFINASPKSGEPAVVFIDIHIQQGDSEMAFTEICGFLQGCIAKLANQ